MAGFMSPGLGFATGAGAFIGGFAKQANENIEREHQEERQNDIIWMNRFERGLAEYNKEKETSEFKAKAYNTILNATGGNKKLADAAFLGVLNDPKSYGDYLNWAIANKDKPNWSAGNDYQSNMMDTLQSGLNSKYNNLQQIYGQVRPQGRRFLSMPDQPGSNQPNFQGGSAPSPSFSNGPSVTPQPIGNSSPVPTGNNTPDQLINENNNPSLNDQINKAPSAGETPLDTNPVQQTAATGTPAPNTNPNGFVRAPNGDLVNPQVAQNNTPSSDYVPFGKQMTPYQEQRLGIEKGNQDLAKQRLQLDTQRKPATPEEAANISIATDDAKKYLHDPKSGLQTRMASVPDMQRLNFDISSMVDVLNRGFKASAVQPLYDEMNRFTSGLLGISLNDLGIDANKYQDVNIMKKDIANGVISRLSTLHFGRITNFEAGLVLKGFTSNANDPNTNIQIALALQNSVRAGINQAQAEEQAVRSAEPNLLEGVRKAREVAAQLSQQYYNANNAAPWPQLQVNQDAVPKIAQFPVGTWFENKTNGKMIRVLGMDNGYLALQDAEGTPYRVPMFPGKGQ